MLYIAVNLEERNWLEYIFEEFRRINKANFDIKVIAVNEAADVKDKNVIYYTREFIKKVSIIDRHDVLPGENVTVVGKDLFILDGTDIDDGRFEFSYDIFWNAFVFLSRLEEYLSENRGKKIKSYSFNHLRSNKDSFSIPIVNNLFNEFEQSIKTNFPNLTFGNKQKPIIELSHDIDYIDKTAQLRIKQTAFNIYNILRNILSPAKFIKNGCRTARFLFSNPSYWCFDYWEELEKRMKKRSIFYVYSKTKKQGFKSMILDPSYDISKNKELRIKLKYLIIEGFEVGLHGSFNSAVDERLMRVEKEALESFLGLEITKVRQHWLRYEENITPYTHNKLFKYDSTLGWNDRIGFRSGSASRYRPYDHKNQRVFDFYETPQIIMDSNIFDYSDDSIETIKKAIQMLKILQEYKTSYVAISWHQRVCSSDYRWDNVYEKLLEVGLHVGAMSGIPYREISVGSSR